MGVLWADARCGDSLGHLMTDRRALTTSCQSGSCRRGAQWGRQEPYTSVRSLQRLYNETKEHTAAAAATAAAVTASVTTSDDNRGVVGRDAGDWGFSSPVVSAEASAPTLASPSSPAPLAPLLVAPLPLADPVGLVVGMGAGLGSNLPE